VLIRHLWQLKIVVFLHWCLIYPVLLSVDHRVVSVIGVYAKTFSNCEHNLKDRTCFNLEYLIGAPHVSASTLVKTLGLAMLACPGRR
jgi:hypothetical protein